MFLQKAHLPIQVWQSDTNCEPTLEIHAEPYFQTGSDRAAHLFYPTPHTRKQSGLRFTSHLRTTHFSSLLPRILRLVVFSLAQESVSVWFHLLSSVKIRGSFTFMFTPFQIILRNLCTVFGVYSLVLFYDRVSCSPGWAQNYYAVKDDPGLVGLQLSPSRMLGNHCISWAKSPALTHPIQIYCSVCLQCARTTGWF